MSWDPKNTVHIPAFRSILEKYQAAYSPGDEISAASELQTRDHLGEENFDSPQEPGWTTKQIMRQIYAEVYGSPDAYEMMYRRSR